MSSIQHLLESPYTALCVAIILGAVALSGKFTVIATQILLVAAWAVALVGLRGQPLPILIGTGALVGGGLILLAYWFRPDAVPQYSGVLVPKSDEVLFEPNAGIPSRVLEIGDSGTKLISSDRAQPVFKFFKNSELRLELVDGQLKVSTKIMDQSGKLVAELIRNEWKVAPPPQTWDRNYSDDALEVRDARGQIALQVKVLADRIQIQGEWWGDDIHGFRLVKNSLLIFGPNFRPPQEPEIEPMFVYPSDSHLGELRK
jgi:hypothetical protein